MIIDLVIGIVASLIASLIVGFLGNKAVSKQNSIILKIYTLFLPIAVFVCCSILCIALNKDFGERIAKLSEVNLLRFYSNCIHDFVWIFLIVALLTCAVIAIEAYDRGARRDHEENMDRFKQ